MAKRPHTRLRDFRVALGLSLRQASQQLGVSHVALRTWETVKPPEGPYRDLIEVWSGVKLPASMWPLSPTEKKVAKLTRRLRRKQAAAVEAPAPARSGPGADSPDEDAA